MVITKSELAIGLIASSMILFGAIHPCFAQNKSLLYQPGRGLIWRYQGGGSSVVVPSPYINWKMTDQTISTNIIDTGGNNLDLILNIPASPAYSFEALYVKQKPSVVASEYSMYFMEQNDAARYLFHEDNLLLDGTNTDLSIGVWYYSTKAPQNYAMIIGKGNNVGYQLADRTGDRWAGRIYDGATATDSTISYDNLHQWTHLCWTYDYSADTMFSYSNGILVTTTTSMPKIPNVTNLFAIGWDYLLAAESVYGYVCQPYMTACVLESNLVYGWVTSGVVPTNEPLAYWKFTNDVYRYEDSGTNSLWHGLNVSASGTTASNNARYFDGVNDYAVAAILTNYCSTKWTKSFWLNAVDYNSLYYNVVYSFDNSSAWGTDDNEYYIRVGGGYNSGAFLSNSICVIDGDHNQCSSTASNVVMPDKTNSWWNLCVTYNSTATPPVCIYIDATKQTLASTNFIDSYGWCWREIIGARGDINFFWHGSIDDIREWNVDLTQEEITQLVSEGAK